MNNQQTTIKENNTGHSTMPNHGRRGFRYYLLILVLIAWGFIFLLTASTARTRLSPYAFLGTAILLYFGLILRNVCRSLNPVRTPVLSNPITQMGVDYEDVVFNSRDGWPLSGWFIPSQRGTIVILTHGLGGNRLDLMPAASLLIEDGFGALMYDMRAHGRSTGNLGTWGWLEVNDLNGAVDYLQKAASGVQEPSGILASIGKISPRPLLLVASGEGRGADLMRTFFDQAGEPKDFWQVPEAGHGWISIKRPEEYLQQLCGFFQRYLNGDEIIEYT